MALQMKKTQLWSQSHLLLALLHCLCLCAKVMLLLQMLRDLEKVQEHCLPCCLTRCRWLAGTRGYKAGNVNYVVVVTDIS
jgi:hypothetical protein